jgi:hypothetical protein
VAAAEAGDGFPAAYLAVRPLTRAVAASRLLIGLVREIPTTPGG